MANCHMSAIRCWRKLVLIIRNVLGDAFCVICTRNHSILRVFCSAKRAKYVVEDYAMLRFSTTVLGKLTTKL